MWGHGRGAKTSAGNRGGDSSGASPENNEDLFDHRPSPRTEALVAAAVQWADRIMRKIDNVFGK